VGKKRKRNNESKRKTCYGTNYKKYMLLHFARQDKKSDPLWMLFESHTVALSFEHIIGA